MKTFDYLELGEIAKAPESTLVSEIGKIDKVEEVALPAFSKEIPASVKRKEGNDTITIDYKWNTAADAEKRVKQLVFKKGEPFDGLYRMHINKGESTFIYAHKSMVYTFRKTTAEVAEAVLKVAEHIKESIAEVIGYVKTLVGNIYLISKLVKGSWSFDEDVAKGDIKLANKEDLSDNQRNKLFGLITERLAELNSKSLVIKNFSMSNVVLTQDAVLLTDLRSLRVARKKSSLVEEYKKAIRYLMAQGFGSREDAYHAAAHYCAAMEEACHAWYQEKAGKKAADSYEIAVKMEKEIC